MSKASELAKRAEEAESAYRTTQAAIERAEWLCPSGGSHAKVDGRGRLLIRTSDANRAHLEPHEAVELARWILDTFGGEATS